MYFCVCVLVCATHVGQRTSFSGLFSSFTHESQRLNSGQVWPEAPLPIETAWCSINCNIFLKWVFKFYYDLHVPILYVEIRGWKNSRQAHEGPRRLLWITFSLFPFSLQVLVVELRCSGLHDGCLTRWAISLILNCSTFCVNFSHPHILKPKEITAI